MAIDVKKAVVEAAEKLVGRGPEVQYRKDVEAHVNSGQTQEQAERRVFSDYLMAVTSETHKDGSLDYESPAFRALLASTNEMFERADIKKFKQDAGDTSKLRRLHTIVPSTRQVDKMRKYFKKKTKGEGPNNTVLTESVRELETLEEIAFRLNSDISSSMSHLGPADEIRARAEYGADIGRILLAKENLERHENKAQREQTFIEANERWKDEAKKSLTVMMWDAPTKWLKKTVGGMLTFGKNPLRKSFEVMFAQAEFLAVETYHGGKLLASTLDAMGKALNKVR